MLVKEQFFVRNSGGPNAHPKSLVVFEEDCLDFGRNDLSAHPKSWIVFNKTTATILIWRTQ